METTIVYLGYIGITLRPVVPTMTNQFLGRGMGFVRFPPSRLGSESGKLVSTAVGGVKT